ncbi:MAG TPA: hypothetical protein VFE23_00440 [Usitatibacter sp.]|jgi:hypothetical protein|nr:hypothetical protein [Usitatibacter sp.]
MSRTLEEPPFVLDAARVVRYAPLDMAARGRGGVVVDGVPLDASMLRGVAIAEALLDGTIFLLNCNERWETLAASHHPDFASAEHAAAATYGGSLGAWVDFRELTDEEQREVQTTRAFLRDLAAEEFGG